MGISDDPIHIWFERSGGFAGMSVSVEIDSDSISQEEKNKLFNLLDQCSFFKFSQDHVSTGMPDQYIYRITIEKAEVKKELEFNETALPEEFRPLVDFLMKKARSR